MSMTDEVNDGLSIKNTETLSSEEKTRLTELDKYFDNDVPNPEVELNEKFKYDVKMDLDCQIEGEGDD